MIDFQQFSDIFNTVMALNGFEAYAREDYSRKFYDLTDRLLTVNKK